MAVLTSTHNLCFGVKTRNIGKPLHTPVLLYESGIYGGVNCTDIVFLMTAFGSAVCPVYNEAGSHAWKNPNEDLVMYILWPFFSTDLRRVVVSLEDCAVSSGNVPIRDWPK